MPERARILVVDDEEKIRDIVAHLLGKAGYEVRKAAGGEEGIAAAEEFRPHAILLDVMMPGMDGFAACRVLRQKKGLATVPVIFLTAKKGPRNWLEAKDSGAVAYLEKPFQKDILLALVSEVLKNPPAQTPA